MYELRHSSNYLNFGYWYPVTDCQTQDRMNKWINENSTEQQTHRDAWGSVVCAHSTCHSTMNNVCLRTVCKWFRRSNGHLTVKCEHCRYHVWGAIHDAFWKIHSIHFWLKSRNWENTRTFNFHTPKLSQVLQRGFESTRRLVEDSLIISVTKKCSHLRRLRLSWILSVRDNFWKRNTSVGCSLQ